MQTGEAAAAIGGPLLAGTVVSLIRFQGVVLIDALTFVAGMVTLALVKIPHQAVAVEARVSLWREAGTGFQYVRQRTGLFGLLGVYGYVHFVFAMASVLIAPLLLSFSTAAMLGLQYAISGCGLLVGGLAIASTGGPKQQVRAVLVYTLLGGLCLAAHGLKPSFTLIATFGFLLFMTLPVVDASHTSIWQKKVPSHLQGRCFAIQQFLLNIAMAMGFALARPLSDRVFEPLMTTGALLAHSVGAIIGAGPGRGIGLMFICLGMSMALVALSAYCSTAIREIDEMQDESFSAVAVGSALNGESTVVAQLNNSARARLKCLHGDLPRPPRYCPVVVTAYGAGKVGGIGSFGLIA